MPFLARSLLVLGSVFLAHAAYSAKEHTRLLSLHGSSTASTSTGEEGVSSAINAFLPALKAPTASLSVSSLPSDITAETLVALLLITIGIVLSAEPLKPIRWNEWAAEVEHGEHGKGSKYIRREEEVARLSTAELGQKLYGGPSVEGFGWLENGRRMGFFNIKAKKKEFAEELKKEGAKEMQS